MLHSDHTFEFPQIKTERLLLRPFTINDAEQVRVLLDDKAVAATTLNIPHPYSLDHAQAWIMMHPSLFVKRENLIFAIEDRHKVELIGAIELRLEHPHDRATLGYWIGRRYWNQGYCTEAGKAVIRYGFEKLHLNRIHASVSSINPASRRVLEKLGLTHEGHHPQQIKKWGAYYDTDDYGIIRKRYTELGHD